MSALGKLVASLMLDAADFIGPIKKSDYEAQKFAKNIEGKVNRSVKGLTSSMKGFAIGAAGAVGAITSVSAGIAKLNDTFQRLDKAAKDSARLGVPIEQLTALQYAAELSGVQTDKLGDALKDLNKNIADAANGSAAQVQAFGALGVSVKDAQGKTRAAADVLSDVADVFSSFPDGPQKSAIAMKVFGEAGLQLIPLLNSGSEGISSMAQEAAQLGTTMSESTAAAAELFNDNMAKLSATMDGFALSAAGEVLPFLNEITGSFVRAAKAGEGFLATVSATVSSGLQDEFSSASDVQRAQELVARISELEGKLSKGTLTQGILAYVSEISPVTDFLTDSTRDLAQAKAELAILDSRIDAQNVKLSGSTNDLTEQLKMQREASIEAYFAQQKAQKAATQAVADLRKQEQEAAKVQQEANKAAMDWANTWEQERNDRAARLDSLKDGNKALRLEIQEIGLGQEALSGLRAERLREAAALKESEAIRLESKGLRAQEVATLREEARLLNERADMVVESDIKKRAAQASEQAVENFRTASADIKKALTTALVDGTQDAGQYIQNYFKSLAIKLTIDPLLGTASNSIAAALGLGKLGAGSNSSSISSFAQLAQLGTSASTGLVGGAGSLISGAGTFFGSSGLSAFGGGVSNAFAGAGAATGATGAGAAFGAALPYVAVALALYSVFGGNGTRTGQGSYSSSEIEAADLLRRASGAGSYDQSIASGAQQIVESFQRSFAELSASLGKEIDLVASAVITQDTEGKAGLYLRTGGGANDISVSRRGDVRFDKGQFDANLAGDLLAATVRGLQDNAQEFAQNIRQLIAPVDTATASVAQLTAVLDGVKVLDAINDTFGQMTTGLQDLSGASLDTVNAFLVSVGGLQGLQGSLTFFYDQFTTEQQKLADQTDQINTAFKTINTTLPATRQEFADLFKSLGTEGFAAINAVLPQIDAYYDRIEAGAETLEQAAQVQSDANSIAQERYGLETRLLQLQGSTAALRLRELNALDESNRSILQQIYSIEDQQVAQRELQAQQEETARIQEQAAAQAAQAFEQLLGYGRSISDYVRSLPLTAGLLGPAQGSAFAMAEFERQRALAASNDQTALQGITGAAGQAIEAARSSSSSYVEFVSQVAKIRAGLSDLPAVQTYEQQSLQALNSIGTALAKVNDAVIGLPVSTADALAAYFNSQVGESGRIVLELSKGFTRLDTSVDGLLSKDEYLIGLAGLASESTLLSVFDAVDLNGDGTISQLEALNAKQSTLAGAIRDNLAPLFNSLDLNVDGGISQAEFSQAFASFGLGDKLNSIFAELDLNGDGMISRLEAGNTTGVKQLTELEAANITAQEVRNMAIRSAGSGLFVRQSTDERWADPIFETRQSLSVLNGNIASLVNFGSGYSGGLRVTSVNRAGQAAYFSSGGMVRGAGTGTSDSIPAYLSNREYVLQASAVRNLGEPFLDALNQGVVPMLGVHGGVDTGKLENLLLQLTAEVRRLRADSGAENRAILQLLNRFTDQFDQATEGGNAMRTTLVEDQTA